MPNWCYTSYVIEGYKEELQSLYEKLCSLDNLPEPRDLTSFGKLGLDNVVELFGGDPEQIDCRGELNDTPQLAVVLTFDTMTAWSELNEVWNLVMNRYKTLKYYYRAEEGGSYYYVTNDADGKYFGRYLVDELRGEPEYYNTVEVLLSDISERTGATLTSWEMMEAELERYNEAHEDDPLFVHEFHIVKDQAAGTNSSAVF